MLKSHKSTKKTNQGSKQMKERQEWLALNNSLS